MVWIRVRVTFAVLKFAVESAVVYVCLFFNLSWYDYTILLYKMIVSVSVCVQSGQRKLPDRFVKFFLGVIDSSTEIVRKILKFYIS